MNKLYYKVDKIEKLLSIRENVANKELTSSVMEIISNVRSKGDIALFDYSKKFDNLDLTPLNVELNQEDIERIVEENKNNFDKSMILAIQEAKKNILDYHKKQMQDFKDNIASFSEKKVGWLYSPIERVGVYIPSGKAFYPSSLLMCALPAVAAGVEDIVVATSNISNPLIAYVAKECGVKSIYNISGAQAIAALAYGTNCVKKVDLIVGPGNEYVAEAKRQVFGHVGVDMVAGPSEILIICDKDANARFVAADLLAQAEHDEKAKCYLVTTSDTFANKVLSEIEKQIKQIEREKIAQSSLNNYGNIIIVSNIDEAIEVANLIAPEHLELQFKGAKKYVKQIKNAGAIFVGEFSTEAMGDYIAGPSHCLPTSATTRFSSVLSVSNFIRRTSYIEYDENSFQKEAKHAIEIAKNEGLSAHLNSILIRKK